MPLVTSREMLMKAQAGRYAVGAFNVENMEMAQAVIAAAQAERAPVMVQTTAGTLKYAPPAVYAGIVKALAQAADVPVALHMDHGSSAELAEACREAGYTSLMIDGSLLPFEENIALTKRVVALAGGLPVEAELGTLGGKEDAHEADTNYTDPGQARDFVSRTGIFSLAVSIGTAHGLYKGEPHIDLARLAQIRALVDAPLVLHGGTGVPDAIVRESIGLGICKVNFATDLRITFSAAARQALLDKPEAFDPKGYLGAARGAVQQKVQALIRLCGSNGRA